MKYDTTSYRKHKRPGAWGSPCPDFIDNAGAQALLDSSVQVGDARYNVLDDYCFRAFSHDVGATGQSLWHGHPIPWSRLPVKARRALIHRGRLTSSAYRKALRKHLGLEFRR